jgi:hypothetical protein
MMRTVTVLLLILALASTSLFAQAKPGGVARELAMGAARTDRNVAVNPFIVMDPSWLLANPAYAAKYADYAWFNLAGGTVNGYGGENVYGNQFGGVNFSFGKEFVLGAILSYDASVTNNLWSPLNSYIAQSTRPFSNPAAGISTVKPIEVFEVIAAADLGDLDVGFGVSYGWTGQDFKSTSAPPSSLTEEGSIGASTIGFRGGLKMDLGGGSAFEASAALRLDNATDKLTIPRIFTNSDSLSGTAEYSASATELEAMARLAMKMSKRFTLVPYAALRVYSVKPEEAGRLAKQPKTKPTIENSALSMSVGVGGEVKVKDFYLAGGMSFAIMRLKSETNTHVTDTTHSNTSTQTITAFPVFNLGVEYPVLDWLTLRGGYYRAFARVSSKTETPAGATSEQGFDLGNSSVIYGGYAPAGNDENGLMTIGVGLKFGDFAMDACMSEQALRRGLGLIGASDNVNTFGYVTLSYCFE